MKYLSLFLLIQIAVVTNAFAQCASNYPLFAINPYTKPEPIVTLGNAPQIDFLRDVTTSEGMINALRANRNSKKYARDIKELNKILFLIGFPNGIDDAALTKERFKNDTLKYNTVGNIGSDDQTYKKVILKPNRLNGGSMGVPGWLITSPTGCFVYIFTKCGNFFYPEHTLIPTDCCHEVKVIVADSVISVECAPANNKKNIRYCIEVCYTPLIKKPNIKGGKSKGGSTGQAQIQPVPECIYLGPSNPVSILFESNMTYKYTASIKASQQTVKVCKDQSVKVPIDFSMHTEGASSVASSPSDLQSPILQVQITDRKLFKALKKANKGYNCKIESIPGVPSLHNTPQ